MLLPINTDPSAILKLLVGAKMVRYESHYTKETKEHRHGRAISAQVIEEGRGERISVACVPDEDVCTKDEWRIRVNAENTAAEKEPALPETVG